ncbi:MAG: R3H domain-containing nucleic acid-binding protein [bacterium]|nr:R3H domain-containing nucleic acid-binding protein [bacterium]
MEKAKDKIQEIFDQVGFDEVRVDIIEGEERISISIKDKGISAEIVPELVDSLTHLARQIARKEGGDYVLVDINDYRKDREALIVKLARAAARKAAATGELISLPAMNAYERRIVHTELSMRPDVATESTGENKDRYVVVRPIDP